MRTYIMSLSLEVYNTVQNGYKKLDVLISKDEKLEFTNNYKEMIAILTNFIESKLVKLMNCRKTKDIWDMLITCCKGDNKVSKSKLVGFKIQFKESSLI